MAAGTKDDPWVLTTPPGSSGFTMSRDEEGDPPALVCLVGSTTLRYRLRAVEDLHDWLSTQPDWVPLGAADEKKEAVDGTVEAWGRSPDNPVGGWYGLRSGYRGRFAMYLPPPPRGAGPGRADPRAPQRPHAGRSGLIERHRPAGDFRRSSGFTPPATARRGAGSPGSVHRRDREQPAGPPPPRRPTSGWRPGERSG